ncbi:hypothetical protein ON010_g8528 [Phytophthora cinnamomi]|nr:hypothetical protein ON010_g8528 [Phytophthora cinnamomi]
MSRRRLLLQLAKNEMESESGRNRLQFVQPTVRSEEPHTELAILPREVSAAPDGSPRIVAERRSRQGRHGEGHQHDEGVGRQPEPQGAQAAEGRQHARQEHHQAPQHVPQQRPDPQQGRQGRGRQPHDEEQGGRPGDHERQRPRAARPPLVRQHARGGPEGAGQVPQRDVAQGRRPVLRGAAHAQAAHGPAAGVGEGHAHEAAGDRELRRGLQRQAQPQARQDRGHGLRVAAVARAGERGEVRGQGLGPQHRRGAGVQGGGLARRVQQGPVQAHLGRALQGAGLLGRGHPGAGRAQRARHAL